MPCGWPPPLSGFRGLHLDTEAQSFPKARESAVMTVRAACGRSVTFHDLARATSMCRPTPPTMSPPMAVMMLTQSGTI
jgi:hypothetical protein